MKLLVKKGKTSKTALIFVQDSSSTTGAGLTGLLFNSASLTWYYYREAAGTGGTQVTLATQTIGTWATGGFIELDATNMPGWYEIGIPDAVLATGADFVGMVLKGATNMAQVNIEIQLVDGLPLTAAQVNAEVVDVLTVDTHAEITAVPAATTTKLKMLQWLFSLARNKGLQTSTTKTLRDDADGATIATSTISSDGTTFTREKWT